MTQPSPVFTARVFSPATSDPACGSVTHTAPTLRPAQASGRYFSFCSWVPRWAMCEIDMSLCTVRAEATPPKLERASSSPSTTEDIAPRPPPPYSTGWRMPRKPIAPSSLNTLRGISPDASHASPWGSIFSRTKRRTCWRTMRRSSSRMSGSANSNSFMACSGFDVRQSATPGPQL